MRILPVLDLLNGHVVRGVGGRRDEYRPIESRCCASSDPADVAAGLVSAFSFDQAYIADLDAIAGYPPAWSDYHRIAAAGLALWIDAGARCREALDQFEREVSQGLPLARLILGLESLAGPEEFADLLLHAGGRLPITFSLDLRGGRPIAHGRWQDWPPRQIADWVIDAGCTSLIVLDLAQVGGFSGLSTLPRCRELRHAYPGLQLISGGGVRHRHDLDELAAAGCDAALVASSLHDGRLSQADCLLAGRSANPAATTFAPGAPP